MKTEVFADQTVDPLVGPISLTERSAEADNGGVSDDHAGSPPAGHRSWRGLSKGPLMTIAVFGVLLGLVSSVVTYRLASGTDGGMNAGSPPER